MIGAGPITRVRAPPGSVVGIITRRTRWSMCLILRAVRVARSKSLAKLIQHTLGCSVALGYEPLVEPTARRSHHERLARGSQQQAGCAEADRLRGCQHGQLRSTSDTVAPPGVTFMKQPRVGGHPTKSRGTRNEKEAGKLLREKRAANG